MRWDHELMRRVQALAGRSQMLDALMTGAARWGPYLEIALWLSLLSSGAGSSPRRHAWLRTALALGLVSAIVLSLRRAVPRVRPYVAGHSAPLVAREPGPSFPSRHAASAVAMAVVVSSAARRRGALMGVLAVWIGIARVYCGLHYPSDVIAGVWLGLLAAKLSLVGSRRSPTKGA